jgi:hypothetical protein
VTGPTVWDHLEAARAAIEEAGVVLPFARDERLDRAYAAVVEAWNLIAYTPKDGGRDE